MAKIVLHISSAYYGFIFLVGLKFVNDQEHLQLKKGDDAVFDFSYIVNSSNREVVTEVVFGYYKREESKTIIAIQGENLTFNPTFNATWKSKIDITADLISTAKLRLRDVLEKTLFDITFYCGIKYESTEGSVEKPSKIKLEIVCKCTTNGYFLLNSLEDP